MPALRLVRPPERLTTDQILVAVLQHRPLYELAALLPHQQPVGRRAACPPYLLLFYGVATRVYRSAQKAQAELRRPAMWERLTRTVGELAQQPDWPLPRNNDGQPLLPRTPPNWDAWRHFRDAYLVDPEVQTALLECFTFGAVRDARTVGLLLPNGDGSLCHPSRQRSVYGDGTVVRPMYRPPHAERVTDDTGRTRVVYPDRRTGEVRDRPRRRFDPDAAAHHGHAGPVHGNNFVTTHARLDGYHGRLVLSVDRVDAPGREADTAVRSLLRVHNHAGAGMQAVIYDGALRGKHIDTLMRRCGVVVVNKVAAAATPGGRDRTRPRRQGEATRWHGLGTWEHDTTDGETCRHYLSAVDGAVCETAADVTGAATVLHRLLRRQVKRPRRASGHFHFNVAYEVPCQRGAFLAWITPHAEPNDRTSARPDAVRLIAPGEPDWDRLYGLRNDAENANAEFKRTLLVDRAMSLGWRRQLLEVLMWAILNNAITMATAQATDDAAA